MKMYYFNPNDYGEQYFVLAENKIKAHEYLLKHLEEQTQKPYNHAEFYRRDLNMWKKVNPLDQTTFPDKYTLDEHELGSVIQSEIC